MFLAFEVGLGRLVTFDIVAVLSFRHLVVVGGGRVGDGKDVGEVLFLAGVVVIAVVVVEGEKSRRRGV